MLPFFKANIKMQKICLVLSEESSFAEVDVVIMCHCGEITTCREPLLVNREAGVESLYDNELDSDVVFLVGMEPDAWRIPAHKKILVKTNPVFRALLEGPLSSNENTIVIEDVPSRAFDYLLRYLYGKKITFQTASTALSTLYAAHKYLCSGLIELCVKYLDENLNTRNVLEIYTHARLYKVEQSKGQYEPSAPVLTPNGNDLLSPSHSPSHGSDNGVLEKNPNCLPDGSIPFWSEALVYNCLQFIDEHADQVLNQEAIEDMSREDLREIVRRDTLKISSEYSVFSALDRWADRECKRRKLNIDSKSRRLVLGDLIYEIRFPFLSSDEFISGPIERGLLNQQELRTFSTLISKSKNVPQVPANWVPHIEKVCRKRIYNENESFTLSQRTYLIEWERNKEKDYKKSYSIFKKFKGKNKEVEAGKNYQCKNFKNSADENERSCLKCFPDCLIDILICVFD